MDALAEKRFGTTPYSFVSGNPLMIIDLDGQDEWEWNAETEEREWISDIGRSMGIDFYHTGQMDDNGKEITQITDANGNSANMTDGRSLLSGGVSRDKKVDWKTITAEFLSGTGPERSVFEGDHPANEAIQEHYLYEGAVSRHEKTGENPVIVNWGPLDVFRTRGTNMQAQMMGSYGVSFYQLGDRTLSVINDSKSRTSLFLHLPVENVDRSAGTDNRLKTTQQVYMFFNK